MKLSDLEQQFAELKSTPLYQSNPQVRHEVDHYAQFLTVHTKQCLDQGKTPDPNEILAYLEDLKRHVQAALSEATQPQPATSPSSEIPAPPYSSQFLPPTPKGPPSKNQLDDFFGILFPAPEFFSDLSINTQEQLHSRIAFLPPAEREKLLKMFHSYPYAAQALKEINPSTEPPLPCKIGEMFTQFSQEQLKELCRKFQKPVLVLTNFQSSYSDNLIQMNQNLHLPGQRSFSHEGHIKKYPAETTPQGTVQINYHGIYIVEGHPAPSTLGNQPSILFGQLGFYVHQFVIGQLPLQLTFAHLHQYLIQQMILEATRTYSQGQISYKKFDHNQTPLGTTITILHPSSLGKGKDALAGVYYSHTDNKFVLREYSNNSQGPNFVFRPCYLLGKF